MSINHAKELFYLLKGSKYGNNYVESLIKKLTNKRLKIVELLNTGFYGAAYLLSDGTVLKATTDVSEANSCAALIGKKNKRLVNIYQVGKLNKKADFPFELKDIWLIRREYVSVMFSREEKKIVSFLTKLRNVYEVSDGKILLRGEAGIKEMIRIWCIRDAPTTNIICVKAIRILAEILKELNDKGITRYKDFHKNNLGIKKGKICVFDLGYDAKAPKVKMKRIEAKMKR